MAERVLSLREINRATLHRQMLLESADVPVLAAVERLVGLQAQAAQPPFIGLWTRLRSFQRDDLARLIQSREVIKATWLRATLHLITAGDFVRLRATLQPVLTQASEAIAKGRSATFDLKALLAVARAFILEKPRTFAEISVMLTEWLPDQDVSAMRYTVRTHLPMVQVPVDGPWCYPSTPAFTLAEDWIGQPVTPEEDLRLLALRYLAAFGPASVTDMQTWSGLARLKELFEKLRPELVVYHDEHRRELFDLPGLALPSPDLSAPVRFLPEYDNLLLSHKDRTRIIADEYRSRVFLPGLRVRATFLVEGFVGGAWKLEKAKTTADLQIEPFSPLAPASRAALEEEAQRLVRFIEPEAKSHEVHFLE